MRNVAVYGGSFDPPHLGHVMVPTHLLLNDPSIHQVLITVCYQQTGKNLTHFRHRMEMARLAFGWLPRVEVSAVEGHLGGESATLRTMEHLHKEHPDWALRFVMGSDLLETCHTWEGWAELEALAPPLPVGRAGISPVREGQPTPISPLVSSTIVRGALYDGNYSEAERYLPAKVLEYIVQNKLYQRNS